MTEASVLKLNIPLGHVHKTAKINTEFHVDKLREDDEHLIIPAVITMEGVHNGSYKQANDILAAADMAKGRYVTFGHPDTIVVTNHKQIRGHMENIKTRLMKRDYKDKTYELPQLLCDLYVCKKRASKKALDSIRKGEVTDDSIGYWCKDTPKTGEFMGVQYNSIETEILIDHTAILFDEKGACECREDGTGCGLMNSQSGAAKDAVQNDGGGGASLAPTPPPDADTAAAPNFPSPKTEINKEHPESQEQGMSGTEDNVMTNETKTEGATAPPADKSEPKQNAAPVAPSVEQDAALAAERARAAALQAKVDAFEKTKKEDVVSAILGLKGIPKDNSAERAKYDSFNLPDLEGRLSAMNDMAATINANLMRGAPMAQTNKAEVFGHKGGGTVGAKINGQWTRGYDHKEA